MENSGGDVNDQNSGWLEVKKKQRGGSKFSLQSWVRGPSGKHNSKLFFHGKIKNSHGRHGRLPSKEREYSDMLAVGTIVNSASASNRNDKGLPFLDKCVVKQDESSNSTVITSTAMKSQTNSQDILEVSRNKSDVLPKIKWGDFEDEDLVVHQVKTTQAETKIKINIEENSSIAYKKSDDDGDINSCDSLCNDCQGTKVVVTSLDADHASGQILPLSERNESFNNDSKEVNEVKTDDVDVQKIVDDEMVNLSEDVTNCKEICQEDVEPTLDQPVSSENPVREAFLSSKTEDGMIVELQESVVISGSGDPEVPKTQPGNGSPSPVVMAQAHEVLPLKSSEPETSGESVTASVELCGFQQESKFNEKAPKIPSLTALSEDAGESKERFRQRLWCFLFENLNRAVDELYLLCELECDMDQMKEAILVLEEATYDFQELATRVKDFENMKKSSSMLIDEMPITMKTDHRRPHALSWEVRRMTTSPHRAEILSSSLEIFKKIQQERASAFPTHCPKFLGPECANQLHTSGNNLKSSAGRKDATPNARDPRGIVESGRSSKAHLVSNGRILPQNSSVSDSFRSRLPLKDGNFVSCGAKSRRDGGPTSETEKQLSKKERAWTENIVEDSSKSVDPLKRQISLPDKDKEKRNATSLRSMDAWKEKRNWEAILGSPYRVPSCYSHSPGMSRKSAERARILHDKLMSLEKKKKTALDLKREAEEKHARAMRIRNELESERVQKLQRSSEKLIRVNEWQAVRSIKLREGMYARHQRGESRHEAFIAQVVRRANDESSKVNEVRFITSLNEENKKLILRQKLYDSELRRAEKLQVMKTKQKEDLAREEAVLERRKLIEAEKLQRLAETQRKKEEAQVRREEERKASSAAREARAMEQLRRKEARAKARQEEAELLAQKLAEKLSESEQRRKIYLEQIRERASMDFRDQTSPLLRRSTNNESQGRVTSTKNNEENRTNNVSGLGVSSVTTGNVALQQSLKRRIKRVRQKLMAQKYDFLEPPFSAENAGIGYRTAVGTARAKISRWLQDLQRLRQARKEGAASIGLITAEMIKFFDGKEPELQASRQAGLLDFIASALPASHTSKPEACQVTIYLLRLLKVVLAVPHNRSYFVAQNLLPPLIPMLSAALENYIKIAASLNIPGTTSMLSSKTSAENFESLSDVLDGFLWIVTAIIGHTNSDGRQLQMQDGLLELVISYQVIHRLRDLFALYDRPQVEGSPFPSSIILSINLLTVLTSRPRIASTIAWESCSIEILSGTPETKVEEAADFGYSNVRIISGDQRPPLSVINGSSVVPLPGVPEDKPLDESCNKIAKDEDKPEEQTDDSGMVINLSMAMGDDQDESKKNFAEDIDKSKSPKMNEKNPKNISSEEKKESISNIKQPAAYLLSVISETGLVSLPSLLTAVLLQANNRSGDQTISDCSKRRILDVLDHICNVMWVETKEVAYVLPSNFEEVATGVLKVLNNLALMDINFLQSVLARPDLKMEFFHLTSFLLSHCTVKWKVASDQIGLLLLESLSLLGYFALFHPGNQAVLRWGKSPTILHKVCDLPFVFFSDTELMPLLGGTLVAACFGCEQNKGVVQHELSTDMLLSLLKSCRNSSNMPRLSPTRDNALVDDSSEGNQLVSVSKKSPSDIPQRSTRPNGKSNRISTGKSGSSGNGNRIVKMRNPRDGKASKSSDDTSVKQNLGTIEASSTLMLHSRFPGRFVDKAEQFFSEGPASVDDDA
ncbi:S phase cyclin A-associated protein in the endoplasmic reticulum, N-terminal [Dillenia turbinata]|uniref:S phase cyclin A-associated protein in the endoplasmic reticulum, N-terminal n=1 Tax=Dillenia turbinata TaxID=194707 RepID=A0AAN8Z1D8_9MAGN